MSGHLTLRVALEGAAMEEREHLEVARMLVELAGVIEAQGADYAHSRRLMDSCGNTLGEVQVIRPREP